jgi:hypothetical protein
MKIRVGHLFSDRPLTPIINALLLHRQWSKRFLEGLEVWSVRLRRFVARTNRPIGCVPFLRLRLFEINALSNWMPVLRAPRTRELRSTRLYAVYFADDGVSRLAVQHRCDLTCA